MPAFDVQPCPLPAGALLARHVACGAYTDCYTTLVAAVVPQARYVEVFYTGRLFRLERAVLALLMSRPSTDAQARELAAGTRDDFAAWRVEDRSDAQLLLCDVTGRTRSWLMTAPTGDGRATRLYFGSAVMPVTVGRDGRPPMGLAFGALLGFHRLYSRALLASARAGLQPPGAG